jgi:hypothetical protein
MTKCEALELLIDLFPNFQSVWDAEDNYHRNNEDWSEYGLWAEFSYYFQCQINNLSDESLKQLFFQIETIVAADIEDSDPMANAMCTGFLENISSTGAGTHAKSYMGKVSRKFFDCWHRNPPQSITVRDKINSKVSPKKD